VLELVDGEVLGDLLEQIAPLFHLDHVSRHGAYTVRTDILSLLLLIWFMCVFLHGLNCMMRV